MMYKLESKNSEKQTNKQTRQEGQMREIWKQLFKVETQRQPFG